MDTEILPVEIPQFIATEELKKMMPHKGKMFLLDRVVAHDTKNHSVTAQYDIGPRCIFFEEELDGVPSWAGFEFMAQTICALNGIIDVMRGQKIEPGFLLSVVNFEAGLEVLKNGSTVQIKVFEDYCADNVFCYKCELYANLSDTVPAITSKITAIDAGEIWEQMKAGL